MSHDVRRCRACGERERAHCLDQLILLHTRTFEASIYRAEKPPSERSESVFQSLEVRWWVGPFRELCVQQAGEDEYARCQ